MLVLVVGGQDRDQAGEDPALVRHHRDAGQVLVDCQCKVGADLQPHLVHVVPQAGVGQVHREDEVPSESGPAVEPQSVQQPQDVLAGDGGRSEGSVGAGGAVWSESGGRPRLSVPGGHQGARVVSPTRGHQVSPAGGHPVTCYPAHGGYRAQARLTLQTLLGDSVHLYTVRNKVED